MAEPVLIVDDDAQVRRTLERILDDRGYRCLLAEDADDARRCIDHARAAVMLCDVDLPGESGLDLVRDVAERHPSIAPVMVSGIDDHELAETALDVGAYDYVTKPFTGNEVLIAVSSALRRRAGDYKHHFRRDTLEQAVGRHQGAFQDAIAQLAQSERELELSQEETVEHLARALRVRDGETAGNIERVGAFCELIADRLGFSATHRHELRVASMLHDVGKIATPDSILHKPGPLTAEEREIVERHPATGHDILTGSRSTAVSLAATIACTHHERFDGTGYPRGLKGDEIPLAGRVVAVADVFDALTQPRPYRAALPVEAAAEIVRAERGAHFDPLVLDPFLASLDDAAQIAKRVEAPAEREQAPAAAAAVSRIPAGA